MSDKEKEEKRKLTVALDQETFEELEEAAKEERRAKSNLAQVWIEEKLKERKKGENC